MAITTVITPIINSNIDTVVQKQLNNRKQIDKQHTN